MSCAGEVQLHVKGKCDYGYNHLHIMLSAFKMRKTFAMFCFQPVKVSKAKYRCTLQVAGMDEVRCISYILSTVHFYYILATDLAMLSLTCVAAVQHAWPSVCRTPDLTVKTRTLQISVSSTCSVINVVMSWAEKNTIALLINNYTTTIFGFKH